MTSVSGLGRFLAIALLAGAGLLPVAGIAPGPVGAAVATGRVIDFELIAPTATLTVGDTITWTNEGVRPHTVTDRGGMLETGPILPGETGETTFDVPGTYELFCEINPSKMDASVVVTAGPEKPAAVRVQSLDELREGETKRFEPAELQVGSGARIILANVGGLRHSLAVEGTSFKIPTIEPGAEQGRFAGGSDSVVVDAPGTYAFFCEIHPQAMRGDLVVTGQKVEAGENADEVEARAPPRAEVDVVDFGFDDIEVAVSRSGSVTWRNTGSAPHTATFDDVQLDTGRLVPGAEATLTVPEQAGTYSYYCSLHPARMRGVVTVRPVVAEAADGDEVAAPLDEPDDTAGTVFAYLLAAALLGVGGAGLVIAIRR